MLGEGKFEDTACN